MMGQPTVTESQFIALWEKHQSPTKIAKILGISERATQSRRQRIQDKLGIKLHAIDPRGGNPLARSQKHPSRLTCSLHEGIVLVGSDAHLWPGPLTTAQRAFIHFCKLLKPSIVVMNGDVFDGARVSRHPAGIWEHEKRPSVREELQACSDFLAAVSKAVGGAQKVWTWGNHDQRFEYRLSALTPEYEGVPGFALKDHFPGWTMGMSLWVNDVVIKHRANHSGIHAVYNNTLRAGKSIVTGHLHSLKVTPYTDYTGTRYGVDTGTLSDLEGPQFNYSEDNAANHRSGFAILSFREGHLTYPEVVQVWDDDRVEFRGQLVEV